MLQPQVSDTNLIDVLQLLLVHYLYCICSTFGGDLVWWFGDICFNHQIQCTPTLIIVMYIMSISQSMCTQYDPFTKLNIHLTF